MKQLIIFTANGHCYEFNNVTNFKPNKSGIEFDYHGVRTGLDRHAQFENASTAGYAITELEG